MMFRMPAKISQVPLKLSKFSVSSFHLLSQNECFKIFLIQTFLKFSWSEKKFFSRFLSLNFGGANQEIISRRGAVVKGVEHISTIVLVNI